MTPRRHTLRIAAAAFLAGALSLPAQAAAEYYVPPGNSAANQYTESLPGAGGESGGKHKQATPAKALGAKNAKRLEKHGAAGKAAAEVAAETAPVQAAGASPSGSAGSEQGGRKTNGSGTAGGSQSPGSGGGGSSSKHPGTSSGGEHAGQGAAQSQPAGSSAVGQIAGQATGASDGSLGLWLPLAIVLTPIGAVIYWVRTRHAQPGRHA